MEKLGRGLIASLVAAPFFCAGSQVTSAADPKVIATKPQKVGNGWARAYVALTRTEMRSLWG